MHVHECSNHVGLIAVCFICRSNSSVCLCVCYRRTSYASFLDLERSVYLLRVCYSTTIASFKEFSLGGTRSKVQYMPANFYSAPLCKRCTSYGNSVRLSVRPSVRLSHAGILSKRRYVARCSLHRWIAKWSSFVETKNIPQG